MNTETNGKARRQGQIDGKQGPTKGERGLVGRNLRDLSQKRAKDQLCEKRMYQIEPSPGERGTKRERQGKSGKKKRITRGSQSGKKGVCCLRRRTNQRGTPVSRVREEERKLSSGVIGGKGYKRMDNRYERDIR